MENKKISLEEITERGVCGDPRVYNIIQDAKKNDKSFTEKGLFGYTPKFSQSEVREIWFGGMTVGARAGLNVGSLHGQRIDISNSCTNPRQKEFIEKFYKLAEEYNCAIEYHPLHGMCVVQLKNKPKLKWY